MPRFTAPDGTSLHYEVEGAGKRLLCLAGLTRNTRDFDHVAPHLRDVQLIRMDYRGRGLSDWPGPKGYTIAQEAADALALLDHLGLERIAILGTSRGGLIAMVLAATAKNRLSGVMLNDIGPVIGDGGLDKIKAYLGRPPNFKTLEGMAAALPALYPEFTGVPPIRWQAEAAARYKETPEGLVNRYDSRLREAVLGDGAQPVPDLWPLFDALAGQPLGLIRGENSDLLSRDTTAQMRARRPDMIFAEVPGRGHVPFLDEPQSLTAIHRFIEALP
ncbi:MAG: alpha/beta fold hydrolase [Brevirhabdus sp.]